MNLALLCCCFFCCSSNFLLIWLHNRDVDRDVLLLQQSDRQIRAVILADVRVEVRLVVAADAISRQDGADGVLDEGVAVAERHLAHLRA